MKLSVFYHHVREAAAQTGLSESEILTKIKKCDITQLEFDIRELNCEEETKKLLAEAGFEVSSIYEFFELGKRICTEDGRELLRKAEVFHAEKVMLIPGFYHSRFSYGKALEEKRMIRRMKQICKAAAGRNIVPMIEDFDDSKSPIATAGKMLEFVHAVPELRIAFDTGNFMYTGEEEEKAYEILKQKTVHVHCKDRTWQPDPKACGKKAADGRMMYPAAAGSGCVPMKNLLRKLKQDGFDQTLTIEHFDSTDYLRDMTDSAVWLKAAWEEL